MELLDHEGTGGCYQGQTSVSPMVCNMLCNFCGFPGAGSTLANGLKVSVDEVAQPATWRALFSMDHTTNKILKSRERASDSLPHSTVPGTQATENLINKHPLCIQCYAGLKANKKMGQIHHTTPTAIKWKPYVVPQKEGTPAFRILNF